MVGRAAACHDLSVGRVLVAAAVGVLLATACTGGRGSPAVPSGPGSSAPSPATGSVSLSSPAPLRTGPLTTGPGVRPGEVPPVQSALARQHTPEGALAFAAYYFKALDWSLATTDPYLLRTLSEPSCKSCVGHVKGLDELGASRSHVSGARISLQSVRLVQGAFKVDSDFVVQAHIVQAAGQVIRADGASASRQPRKSSQLYVFLSWKALQWRIVAVGGV